MITETTRGKLIAERVPSHAVSEVMTRQRIRKAVIVACGERPHGRADCQKGERSGIIVEDGEVYRNCNAQWGAYELFDIELPPVPRRFVAVEPLKWGHQNGSGLKRHVIWRGFTDQTIEEIYARAVQDGTVEDLPADISSGESANLPDGYIVISAPSGARK